MSVSELHQLELYVRRVRDKKVPWKLKRKMVVEQSEDSCGIVRKKFPMVVNTKQKS